MDVAERKNKLMIVLWRIAGSAFLIAIAGWIIVIAEGAQAPNTRTGRLAAGVTLAMFPVLAATTLAISFMQVRRMRQRLRSGQRPSDFDPWPRD
jgi:hypothetical protein